MKRVLLSLLFLLATTGGFAAATPAPKTVDMIAFKAEQHRATMTIVMIDKRDEHKGAGCSATAVGPEGATETHTLLTAGHCDVAGGTLYLNQSERPFTNGLEVAEKYYDKNDHMLMVVPGVSFKHFIHYDVSKVRKLEQGDYVYLWGNPGLIKDQYREGYATGVMNFPNVSVETVGVTAAGPFTMLAVPIVGGDSGSAVFDARDGQLVGITTWGIFGGMFLGSYPLQFTQDQINQAFGIGNFVYLNNQPNSPKITVNVNVPKQKGIDLSYIERLLALLVFCLAAPLAWKVSVFVTPLVWTATKFSFRVALFVVRSLISSAARFASDFKKA